jgi:hypothetical protein
VAQLIDNRQNVFAYNKQEKRSLPSICNDMQLGYAQNITELDQQPTPPNSPKNNGAAKL